MDFFSFFNVLLMVTSLNALQCNKCNNPDQPHILFVLGDDYGHGDLGLNGNNGTVTPNLDLLGYTGRPMNDYHGMPICTPARAAVMTGYTTHRIGMQQLVMGACEKYALPKYLETLPQLLKKRNYKTHMVGKWHLGYKDPSYTPYRRGFDEFFGCFTGGPDQNDHFASEVFDNFAPSNLIIPPKRVFNGLDFNRNGIPQWHLHGQYATHLFTNESVRIINNHDCQQPLFLYVAYTAIHSGSPYNQMPVPENTLHELSYITDIDERRKIAMTKEADTGIGRIMTALANRKMLDNTHVFIFSDNGAPALGAPDQNFGTNWPLKGNKYSCFEGGTRTMGIVWSKNIRDPGTPYNSMLPIVDLYATMYEAAGGDPATLNNDLDSMSHWKSIVENTKGPRNRMVYNFDDSSKAVREGDWKLITQSYFGGLLDGYSGKSLLLQPSTYNFTAVMNSEAYKAVATVKGPPKITPQTIALTRRQLTIRCQDDNLPNSRRMSACRPNVPCLVNLKNDPCERENLASQRPDIVAKLLQYIAEEQLKVVPPLRRPSDPCCNPKYRGHAFLPWLKETDDDQ